MHMVLNFALSSSTLTAGFYILLFASYRFKDGPESTRVTMIPQILLAIKSNRV